MYIDQTYDMFCSYHQDNKKLRFFVVGHVDGLCLRQITFIATMFYHLIMLYTEQKPKS